MLSPTDASVKDLRKTGFQARTFQGFQLQTQRQKVPALKAAIEDLKAGRLQAGWEKLERHEVIKEVTDSEALRERAIEQHLEALRAGKTSLVISPRHDEARKVASVVRERLKAEGAIGVENYLISVLRRMETRAPFQGSLTLRARPSGRVSYSHRGRVQAWREVDREGNELRDRDARAQREGPAVQTLC
jgi:hypothetical protein